MSSLKFKVGDIASSKCHTIRIVDIIPSAGSEPIYVVNILEAFNGGLKYDSKSRIQGYAASVDSVFNLDTKHVVAQELQEIIDE